MIREIDVTLLIPKISKIVQETNIFLDEKGRM